MALIYSIKNFEKINVVGKIYKVNLELTAFRGKGLDNIVIESKEPFIFLGNDGGDEFTSKKILYEGKIYYIDNISFTNDQYLEVLE